MYTHKNGEDAYAWKVDWNDFNTPGKRINEIMADLEVVSLEEIRCSLSPDFDYASPILDFSIFRGQNRHFCPRLVSFEHQTRA